MYTTKQQKPQQSRVIQSKVPVQRVRTIVIEQTPNRPTHLTQDAGRVHLRKVLRQIRFGANGGNPQIAINNNYLGTFNNPGNQMQINETLILVSHGARYIPIFGYRFPGGLAQRLYNANILPLGYSGEIYLDGCHTGEPGPFGRLGDGSSFAERFKVALNNLANANNHALGQFTVKGNLGAARTSIAGREYIDLDGRTIGLINQNAIRRNQNPNQQRRYMPFARLINFRLNANPPQMAGKYGKVIY